ncbi:hypothetical protein AU476_25980 [Cupriavidus sp. UYMSc13B]|nr:hypothetical protein AU476_25980 [Cupriavidus sp. UYMSc13B]
MAVVKRVRVAKYFGGQLRTRQSVRGKPQQYRLGLLEQLTAPMQILARQAFEQAQCHWLL